MFALLLAAAVTVAPAYAEIDRAIAMHRLDQARMMIAAAVGAGAQGAAVERPLAALAFAAGRNEEALARTIALLRDVPDDPILLEQATLAAMRMGATDEAAKFAKRAARQETASWRVWNALGVIADEARDWDAADHAFARAAVLAPGRYEIANNRGWSLLLRGDWDAAASVLAKAAALAPDSVRTANNLDLARMGLAGDLPARGAGETSADYAARLNDAGVAAQARGDSKKARAAFAQAIHASGQYYARAGANLAAVEHTQ
jgi:Flp pilus assembly protein TadD